MRTLLGNDKCLQAVIWREDAVGSQIRAVLGKCEAKKGFEMMARFTAKIF